MTQQERSDLADAIRMAVIKLNKLVQEAHQQNLEVTLQEIDATTFEHRGSCTIYNPVIKMVL